MKRLLALLCCIVGAAYASEKSAQQQVVQLSGKCFQDQEDIRHDAMLLRAHFKGILKALSYQNNPEMKPSGIIKWCRDQRQTNNERIKSLHKPTQWYLDAFIKDEDLIEVDNVFEKKYQETNDVSAALMSAREHFDEHILRKPFENLCNDLILRDAAKMRLDKLGIRVEDGVCIIEGSDYDTETMKQINEDFKIVYKK